MLGQVNANMLVCSGFVLRFESATEPLQWQNRIESRNDVKLHCSDYCDMIEFSGMPVEFPALR